jgi:transposase
MVALISNTRSRRPAPPSFPRAARRAHKEQLDQIPVLLACGAEAYDFESNRWTLLRVAAVLKQVCGLSYHPARVSRLLRKNFPDWRTLKN